jgi:hypothetical protein
VVAVGTTSSDGHRSPWRPARPSFRDRGRGQHARHHHGTHADRAWAGQHPSIRPPLGEPSQMSPFRAAVPTSGSCTFLQPRVLDSVRLSVWTWSSDRAFRACRDSGDQCAVVDEHDPLIQAQ